MKYLLLFVGLNVLVLVLLLESNSSPLYKALTLTSSNEVHVSGVVLPQDSGGSATVPSSGGGGSSNNDNESGGQEEQPPEEFISVSFDGWSVPFSRIKISVNGVEMFSLTADEKGFFEGEYLTEEDGLSNFSYLATYSTHVSPAVTFSMDLQKGQFYSTPTFLIPPIFFWEKDSIFKGWAIPGATISLYSNTDLVTESLIGDSRGFFSFDMEVFGQSGEQRIYVGCSVQGLSCGSSAVWLYEDDGIAVVNSEEVASSDSAGEGGIKELIIKLLDGNNENIVNEENHIKEITVKLIGDINDDGKVNYVDFQMLRNVFIKKEYIASLDLDKDEQITLKDFSLIAYQWAP